MNRYAILVHTKADIPGIDGICMDAINQALIPSSGPLAGPLTVHFGFGGKDKPHTILINMEDECPNIDVLCMDALSLALKPYDDSPGLSFYFGDLYAAPEINDAPRLEQTEIPSRPVAQERETREDHIVLDGRFVYSFGKNGPGLSDELLKIGKFVKDLSKDNYIYLENATIDALDDVYDLTFRSFPKEEHRWLPADPNEKPVDPAE